MKIKINEANRDCNYCKLQIHWNKIEWMNPKSCDEQKNPFCVSSKTNVLKITFKLHIGLVTRT